MDFETGKSPNKQTIEMGRLIRVAREEAGLSQEELAKLTYRKRLAISELENGKVEVNAWTLVYLAKALKKPITYFYPQWVKVDLEQESLSDPEKELIILFREIPDLDLQKLIIIQVRAIKDYSLLVYTNRDLG